jgi:hypothetical protein
MMWSHFVQNQADPLPFWFGFRFLDCRSDIHGSVDRQPISGAVPLFATKPVARPAALGKTYGLRDLGNLEYFKRAMNRRVYKFVRQQETLWD